MNLHLPVNWVTCAHVRMLSRKLVSTGVLIEARLAYVLLWTEWAQSQAEWRPLSASAGIDWSREELAFVVGQFLGLDDESCPKFMAAAVDAGVIQIERRGDLLGIVLSGFWKENAHLSPDYVPMQKRGGFARAAALREREVAKMATQQRELLESQGALFVAGLPKVTADAALALVMRIDRAAGRQVRVSSEYGQAIMDAAVHVSGCFSEQDIETVLAYLISNRGNPRVVSDAQRVLENFEAVLREAAQNG